MSLNKSKVCGVLPADVKAALQGAVSRLGSQTKVAEQLGVSTAVISTLLHDKYPGNVELMEQRIRGQYMHKTVKCPVMGILGKHNCLDYQAQPVAFTNPLRVALGRACKTCINRKDL